MKKMMILACLVFSVTAFTAVAADVAKIQSTSNEDMVTELAALNPDGWVDYLSSAIQNGDDALIKRVIVNAQTALNTLDNDPAAAVAAAINDNVQDVAVARYLTGKYALAYTGAVNSDGKVVTHQNLSLGDNVGEGDLDGEGVNLKSNTVGKGVSSGDDDDDDGGDKPIPPVSGRSSIF